MAQNDLEFTSEITLDTTKARKSLQELSAEVSKVFQQTSAMAAASLLSSNFGFGGIVPGYTKNVEQLKKILGTHAKNITPLLPNATAAEKAVYKKSIKDLENAQKQVNRLNLLTGFMTRAAQYDPLFGNVEQLRKDVIGGNLKSKVALGRGDVYQRFLNQTLGLFYRYAGVFPDIIGQEQLENAEQHRDRNRKTISQARADLRRVQDKKYWRSAISRAGDYLLLSDNPLLQQLSEAYGFGLGTKAKELPENVDAGALMSVIKWAEAGMSAQEHKEALLRGGLSKEMRDYHYSGYKSDMENFIKLQKQLFPQQKSINENLKKLNKSDLLKLGGGSGSGLNWLKVLTGSGVALAGMNRLAGAAGNMLESYWGESIQRNVYASQQAYYKRWEIGGKVAGSAAGGIIGAIIGGLIAGPAGSKVLAGIGAGIGGGIGSSAGLYGTYKGKKYEGDLKSSNDMMARVRAKTLYGRGYNPYFAQQITDFGIANGEAALQQMSHSAQTFRARVMTGQVGEQEWFYLSMMPNYFNALMSGVTGHELANIYAKDLDAISDPSIKYMVGESLGGTEALAMATSPFFSKNYARMVSTANKYDTMLQPFVAGYAGTKAWAVEQNVKKDYEEIVNSAFRADPTIFGDQYLVKLKQMGISESKSDWHQGAAEAIEALTGKKVMVVKEINNVINVDGEEVKRETKTADQMYEESLQSFYVGGN